MHAKGFCQSCYVSTFHLDKIKAHNVRKMHNLDYNTYRKITKLCVICNFDKIVDIHHLDHNHQNNSQTNLIGICPNHHKMIHDRRYQKEIFKELKEKGFDVPELPAKGFLYKEKT
ncbi:hypothetical protein CMI47_05735 [Candidatus Pacearchaeota archaeon]|nr:hypothetical protein [Candidatus Pacearchaeota archaeon]